jgi:predicted  nucleic acid-binding Zn-ribbon protein
MTDTPARPDAGTQVPTLEERLNRHVAGMAMHGDNLSPVVRMLMLDIAEAADALEDMAQQIYDSISKSEAMDLLTAERARLEAENAVARECYAQVRDKAARLEAENARLRAAITDALTSDRRTGDAFLRRALTSAGEGERCICGRGCAPGECAGEEPSDG